MVKRKVTIKLPVKSTAVKAQGMSGVTVSQEAGASQTSQGGSIFNLEVREGLMDKGELRNIDNSKYACNILYLL